jgi:hypothetical protein
VLKLELQRLDAYLAAHHAAAVEGDLQATGMALKILEKRCRLLGWFPDKQTAALAVKVGGGEGDGDVPKIELEFIMPSPRAADDELLPPAPKDITPKARTVQPQPRRDYEPKPDPPIIDVRPLPPTSVPITGRKRGFNWEPSDKCSNCRGFCTP